MDPVRNSEWLAQSFDRSGEAILFAQLPRKKLRDMAFLSDQALRHADRLSVPLAHVEQRLRDASQVPVHYVFHTAFGGSTLLARALEEAGTGAALKEPGIISNLHHWLGKADDGRNDRRLTATIALLKRPIGADPASIVKASCFANAMAPTLLAADASSKAIFLCGGLQEFLLAVVKRSIRGRTWARRAHANAVRHTPIDFRFTAAELLELTDLQIAGLTWTMRSAYLRTTARRLGNDRVLVIESDDLFDHPEATLMRASQFLGRPVGEREIGRIVAGPLFNVHSKQIDRPFDNEAREAEHDVALSAHREEVTAAREWVEAVVKGFGLPVWA